MLLRLLFLCAGVATATLGAVTYDIAPAEVGSGFALPVAVVAAPGVNNRLFIVEQHTGQIRILDPSTGTVAATPFLTVTGLATGNEQGLLGLAFHPQYASNGRFYVNCTRGSQTKILRFVANGTPTTPTTAGTETTVLTYDQPQTNHNGGWLGFGPDGYLYISTGDGGSGDDPHGSFGNAQNRASLLGKILRIDIDGGSPYAIPAGNPYASTSDGFADEIWCWGLRNPWRCSFDRTTGDLWIGDVGQNNREEVDVCPSGQKDLNFGWRVWEGLRRNYGGENLQAGTHTGPVVDYDRGLGTTVIGGYAYRGSALGGLTGTYFYADYGSRRVWAMRYNTGTAVRDGPDEITDLLNPGNTVGAISSFGEDNAGELYMCSLGGGKVYRIVRASPIISTTSPLPASTINRPYSKTFAASGATTPYTWQVSAGALPAGLSISTAGALTGNPSASGTFSFTVQVTPASGPVGTKAMTLVINPALTITTSTLADATINSAYSQTLATSGGTGAKMFAVTSGTLPTGLSCSTAGVLSGTPSTVQIANFTITATDTVGATASRGLSITVSAAPLAPTFTSTPPLRVHVNSVYTYDANASGNPAPTFSLVSPPTGMAINTTTGVVTWTPTAVGNQSVSVRASNGVSPQATQTFVIAVDDHGLGERPAVTAYLNMPTTAAGAKPALLSQTGIFANTTTLTPSAAMIPYGVNAPFWSDGAVKTRFIAVPDGTTITYAATGAWTFPAGTVLVKHFAVDLDEGPGTNIRRMETRILVVQADGNVYGTTYRWNGNDAERVDSAQTETVAFTAAGGGTRNQTYLYPGPTDCLQCHTPNSNRVLGVNARQLNGEYAYAAGSDNQLRTWSAIGMFSTTLSDGAIAGTAKLNAVGDTSASLEDRVRSYLDANCANCHLPGGAPAAFDARFSTPLANQGLLNGSVYNALGISGARVVVPGDVNKSILHVRVHSTDDGVRMPPIGRYTRDEVADQAISDWIDSLPPDAGSGGSSGGSGGGGCGLGSGLGIFAAILLFLRLRLRGRPT